MSLGKVYHYRNLLKILPQDYEVSDLLKLDFPNKNQVIVKNKPTDKTNLAKEYRDIFIQNYSNYLDEMEEYRSKLWWNRITSPFTQESSIKAETSFETQLENWINNSQDFSSLLSIIETGYLMGDQEYLISYGLDFVYRLRGKQGFELNTKIDFSDYDEIRETEIEPSPSVLVLTNQQRVPLYANINAEYSILEEEIEKNLTKILNRLNDFPSIKLVLLDTTDDSFELIRTIQKNLPKNILVSNISMNSDMQTGYFDKLVLDTLGIRLLD